MTTTTTTADKLRTGDALYIDGHHYPITHVSRRLGSDYIIVRYAGRWHRILSSASVTIRQPIDV